jgi:hypothetical protein
MNEDRVPEEVRRQNIKYVRLRDEWRGRYRDLATLIHEAKCIYKEESSKTSAVILAALQARARDMMQERMHITTQLKTTAYRYI